MTKTELEATARQFAELKAVEAKAKSDAKPLGQALLAELADRKVAELDLKGIRIVRRSRNSRTYSVPVLLRRLARKKPLLEQLLRIDAKEWDRAVKAGEVSEDIATEAFVGHSESTPWVDVTVLDQ